MGAELEFQVIDPAEFAPYDYRAGEARFVLSALPGDELGVEDRLRPQPPAEHPRIDPKARSTCLAVFTEAGGKPLRARLSGERLSVDFAKIDPDARNFTVSEGRVTSCRGLERLPAARVVSMFQRTRSRDLGPAGNDGSPSRP
ncbi:MAG: hypothetical protein HY744_21130 [Deltaproteobacteria bacterium]|nr:hypothetical protein [Deltaproteobacteria bacterium]